MTIPALERRLGRKPPRLLMPDAFVATLVIMQGAVVVTNNLEVILSVLLE
jgi:predicted nucleic acid-binding protein